MRCPRCGTSEDRGGSAFCRACGGPLPATSPTVSETVLADPPAARREGPSPAVARVLRARLEPELGARVALDVARGVLAFALILASTHGLALARGPAGALLEGLVPGAAVREAVAFVALAGVASAAITFGVFRATSRRWRNVR